MVGFLRDLAIGLGDLFFPRPEPCAICDRAAARPMVGLCADCLSRLPFLAPPLCERCGRLLRFEAANRRICAECERERLFFARARAVCLYEGPARAYLHEVKFRRSLSLARALAGLLAVYAREERDLLRGYEVIVPVPLHSRREEERGFNQAAVMAGAVGEALRRPVLAGVLLRTRQTEAQSRLDRKARRENVRGAFRVALPSALVGRRALLVDDIMTTGYTASECARVMLRAGALEIGLLTLANGSLDEEWLEGEKKS
ncbi:MAG: ComF family protein [Alicyclobacillus sp.]|nr:ComF family protein [Alicyclobacillus sp.]